MMSQSNEQNYFFFIYREIDMIKLSLIVYFILLICDLFIYFILANVSEVFLLHSLALQFNTT